MGEALVAAGYRPVAAQRLHEGVVQQIVTQIVSGALPPGSTLPTEIALGEQFGVSRVTIREAVRVLVTKGLVAVRQGSGMQVQPPEQWNHLDPLILFEQINAGHDDALLGELLELRRVVEVEVAALAAVRRTESDLHTLRQCVVDMREAINNPHAFTRLDVSFHDAIIDAAGNRLLAQTLRPASQALLVGRLISSRRPGGPVASERGHEAILAAVEQGEPQAARDAMRQHITQFETDIRAILAQGLSGAIVDLAPDAVR